MSLRPVSAFGRPAGAEGSSHELETLQTDVMRFMAIIGFCLMAIFALVQSLPTGLGDARPKLEHPRQMELDLAALKRHARRLRRQLAVLEQDLEMVRGEMQEALAQRDEAERLRQRSIAEAEVTERRLKESSRRLDWLTRLADRARGELDDVSRSLARARRDLAKTEAGHEALEQQIGAGRRTLTELRRELRAERRALSATETQLQASARELARYQQLEPEREPEPEPTASPPPDSGFTMHFASEDSLSALVQGGQVRLYALLGRQAWKLLEQPGGARFERDALPKTYFEMHAHTVPGRYLKAMQSVVADPLKLTWGVTLPDQTRLRITELMSRRRGGDLVIHGDGRVSIH